MADGKKFVVYIGNQAGIQKFYARVDNENEVFILENFQLFPEDLRDLSLSLVKDTSKITYVKLTSGNKSFELKKDKKEWKINSKKADTYKVDFFLSDVQALRGVDVLTPSSLKLKKPFFTLELKEGGQTKKLEGFKTGEKYYLRTNLNNYVYKTSKETFESLLKEEKDFLP